MTKKRVTPIKRGIELGRIKCGGGDKRQINLSSCGRYIAVCGDSPELRAWHVNFKVTFRFSYSKITRFLEQILIEHMRSICSLESQLHFRSSFFIKICSRRKDIVETFCS